MITAELIQQRTGLTNVVIIYSDNDAPFITGTGDQAIVARVNSWFATRWKKTDADIPTSADLSSEETEANTLVAAISVFKAGTGTNAQAQRAIAWLLEQEAKRRGLT